MERSLDPEYSFLLEEKAPSLEKEEAKRMIVEAHRKSSSIHGGRDDGETFAQRSKLLLSKRRDRD